MVLFLVSFCICVINPGTFFVGPTLHFWYKFLATRFPGKSMANTIQRLAMDQLIFAPVFLPAFFFAILLLDGKPQNIWEKLSNEWISTMLTNWSVWVPAMFINFRFVPPAYYVLYSNCVGVFWNIYLSYVGYKVEDASEVIVPSSYIKINPENKVLVKSNLVVDRSSEALILPKLSTHSTEEKLATISITEKSNYIKDKEVIFEEATNKDMITLVGQEQHVADKQMIDQEITSFIINELDSHITNNTIDSSKSDTNDLDIHVVGNEVQVEANNTVLNSITTDLSDGVEKLTNQFVITDSIVDEDTKMKKVSHAIKEIMLNDEVVVTNSNSNKSTIDNSTDNSDSEPEHPPEHSPLVDDESTKK